MNAYIVLVAKLWDLAILKRDVLDGLENKRRVLKRSISFLSRHKSQLCLELTISAMMYYACNAVVTGAGLRPELSIKSDICTNILSMVMVCNNIYFRVWIFHTGRRQSSWLVNPSRKVGIQV